jgi:Cdc6-like AAA superfamily ATPase
MPSSLITEARALRADELPREIIRRHDHLVQLATALEPVVEGDTPETTFFHGPSGAGKTAVARRGVEKLKAEALAVDSAYVECWDRTSAAVLRRALDSVSHKPVHDSTGRDELLQRLRDRDRHTIVILDEVDQLAEYGVLHDLYQCPTATMLGIANRLPPLYASVDERVGSRISSAVEVRFKPYTDAELIAILEDRADWGLTPNAIRRETLEYIAREADGDARRAISILRHAAKTAASRGRHDIAESIVDSVLGDAERDVRETSLAKLSTDHRRLYEALRGAGEVGVEELYRRYRERGDEDCSDRHIRNLRQKLLDYGLVKRLGSKNDRRYRALEP